MYVFLEVVFPLTSDVIMESMTRLHATLTMTGILLVFWTAIGISLAMLTRRLNRVFPSIWAGIDRYRRLRISLYKLIGVPIVALLGLGGLWWPLVPHIDDPNSLIAPPEMAIRLSIGLVMMALPFVLRIDADWADVTDHLKPPPQGIDTVEGL